MDADGRVFCKADFSDCSCSVDYAKESITLGATEYLMKPVDHDILKDTVGRLQLKAWQEDEKRESQVQEYEKICAKLSQGELKKLLDSYQDQPELIQSSCRTV